MPEVQRPGAKLQKRRTGSASPGRDRGNRQSQQDTPAIPPVNTANVGTAQENGTSPGKEKKSKFRLSNPFHSKGKERKDSVAVAAGDSAPLESRPPPHNSAAAGDSAYFSSEHINSSRSDVNTSAHPSFSSNDRRASRGEQLQAPNTNLQPPATSVTPPTPSASLSGHGNTQQSTQAQSDNVQRDSYTDQRTGNVVTTTTTVSPPVLYDRCSLMELTQTTTTTTTTTGPGGSTTVQQPAGHDDSVSTQANVTGTTGPSPPSPAPPLPAAVGGTHKPGLSDPNSTPAATAAVVSAPGPSSSPPIPNRNNIRNRVELDSVSPGVERPDPLVSPITPSSPTHPHFSYPARAPPSGVPRQIPVQDFNAQQSADHLQQYQAHHQTSHGDRAHPTPLRPGHQSQNQQKQSTLANLKTAAAGIHVSVYLLHTTLCLTQKTGCWRSSSRNIQPNSRQALCKARFSRTCEKPGCH